MNSTIFCNLKKDSRQRMRDTATHLKKLGFDVMTPTDGTSYKDHELYTQRSKLKTIKLKRFFRKIIPVLNIRSIKGVPNEDCLIYSWGAIPKGNNPFIVELDTPYSMSLYNLFSFRIFKFVLRHFLLSKRCKGIVCISEACQDNLKKELGQEVFQKSTVIYPFCKTVDKAPSPSQNGPIKFLFIATQFRLKGGWELLEAFKKINESQDEKYALTMITNLSPTEKQVVLRTPGVRVHDACFDKQQLYDQFYSTHHVFVMPTYQDSFGLVYLEALSFGMPLIATDNYAIREMVRHDLNGQLLTPPFYYYSLDNKPNPKVWNKDIARIVEDRPMDIIYVEKIAASLKKTVDNYTRFSKESRNLFDSVFAEDIRGEKVKRLLKGT